MKLLIKSALILALLFASTFVLIKMSGVITLQDIEQGFYQLQQQPAYWIGGFMALLLFVDLFIAIPTMTVMLLGAFFIGFEMALLFAFMGLSSAALTGYGLSWRWGDYLLKRISNDPQQRQEMESTFKEHGVMLLILSRAAPILPEVSACLAGASRMPFKRFALGWSLGSLPYMTIVCYAGSVSTLENPKPAIFAAMGISLTLWLMWRFILRPKLQQQPID